MALGVGTVFFNEAELGLQHGQHQMSPLFPQETAVLPLPNMYTGNLSPFTDTVILFRLVKIHMY